ncbi:OmpH family outer membrane protein [Nitrosomonas halophila]|uniref:Outer membrane protein n=1 Tax=Nitrosomonas halophila TaxID=44576 RepID=A0A1H3FV40_9PROT|nr:OmpH family outer membrane protein [Nitrosomonas halophila]SDX94677.1 outer membrane protein [Nitrosomonas halophila]
MKFVLQEWRQMASAGFCMMLGLVVLLTLPAASLAQEIKIGVVNTEKILRESIPAVMAQKKIEQEFQARDARIKQLSSQAKALQQELESNDGMTEADRRIKERELATLSRQYHRAQQQMREDLSLRQNEEYGLILDRINQVIQELAELQAYDLILQLQDSVYRSARIDITDQVIKVLDEQASAAEK